MVLGEAIECSAECQAFESLFVDRAVAYALRELKNIFEGAVGITFLDHGEVQASAPVQDYYRAWPMWREKALAGLGAN